MRLLILLALLPLQAFAGERWIYEFEFSYAVAQSSRLLNPSCTKVVPVELVDWYSQDPRLGWEISCGNRQPMYLHFLGRRCWKPLPNLVFQCGWTHMSSPFDQQEVTFDAISVRGRFTFGRD